MKDLFLSHHPNCPKFDNHVIKIKGIRLCIGCFIGYPTAILTILIIYLFRINLLFDLFTMFLLSLILISLFILSPLNYTGRKTVKICQKFFIGVGSGFLFWYIWMLPNPFVINLIYFFLTFGLFLALLNFYHLYGFYSTCKKCEFSMDWEKCGVFNEIVDCFKKNKLRNLFEEKKN
ncbi:MAG: hypothetical protein ACFFAO_03095 [Candidatus Hermodarchaeota archaeon]